MLKNWHFKGWWLIYSKVYWKPKFDSGGWDPTDHTTQDIGERHYSSTRQWGCWNWDCRLILKGFLHLQCWWSEELLSAIAGVHFQNTAEDLNGYSFGVDRETWPKIQSNERFSPLELTVVQSDEKYSLNHVIDIKLLTQLLSWAEGATDLCHRVIIVINTVWHRVLWLWLAVPWVLHCNTRYIAIKTYKEKQAGIIFSPMILLLTYHTHSSYSLTKHMFKRLEMLSLTLLTWLSSRWLCFLSRCKLLSISHGTEKGSKWVAGDVLVVVALVSHLTGAQLLPLNIPALRGNTGKIT